MIEASSVSTSQHQPWFCMEPDPGTFSELCSVIGAQGVQVEPLQVLPDKNPLHDLSPVYGIMLLLPRNNNCSVSQLNTSDNNRNITENNNIYFAKQIMHEAYALHGLLNIILNCKSTINININLTRFKQLTQYQSPRGKGTTLMNTAFLKAAYNRLSCKARRRDSPDSVGYRSIVFIKAEGAIWELDGLKDRPTVLAVCDNQDNSSDHWLDTVYREVLRICQNSRVPLTAWTLIEDRTLVLQRQIVEKIYLRSAIERRLDFHRPDWRLKMNAIYWDEEFRHTIDTNKRSKLGLHTSKQLLGYCQSFTQLPIEHQAQSTAILENYSRDVESMSNAWLNIQDVMLQLYESLGKEVEKSEKQRMDIQRRIFDYTPFIRLYLRSLYEEGHLQSILRNHYYRN